MSKDTARYDGIDVEILDRESHRDYEAVQVRSAEPGVELSDPSGDDPWVPVEEVNE